MATSADQPRVRRARRGGRVALLAVRAAVAAVVAVAVGAGGARDGDASTRVAFDRDTGEPAFRLQSFDGGVVDSAELAGTPVVLNGYAS